MARLIEASTENYTTRWDVTLEADFAYALGALIDPVRLRRGGGDEAAS